MAFLNPLLLFALAGIAIPILLHLLRRKESRFLVFPALRYLTRTTQEHAQIIRLRQLLLLAVRIAAVVLLVAGASRLVLPVGGRDHPPAGIAVVIDNGLTSGAIVGGARQLDSLIARAGQALDRTGSRDRVWVVPAGEPWTSVPSLPGEAARTALAGLGPSGVGADLTTALSRASALLDAAAPEIREIVLISDLAADALPTPPPGARASPDPVTVVPPPLGAPPNRGIAEVRVAGGLTPRAGDLAEVQVDVRGRGAAGVVVRLYVSDRLVASGATAENGTAVLSLPPMPAGWVEGRVEIDPDDLRGDDTGYFAFRAIPAPVVAAEGSLSPFLLDALDVLADAGRIRKAPPGGAASVYVLGPGAPSVPPTPSAVILVPPEDPALLSSMNRTLEEVLPGWRLEAEANAAAVERDLVGGEFFTSLPLRPRVRASFGIVTAAGAPGSWTTLLELSDGDPWLIRTQVQGRTLLVLASPVSEEASDLPTSAALVPLLDLLISLPSGDAGDGGAQAGDVLRVPSGALSVRTPGGSLHAVEGVPSFARTGEVGVYHFLGAGDEVLARTAVNPEPTGDGARLTPEEAVERLHSTWPNARVGDPWPDAVLADRRGREVGRPLAAILLLLLVAETWLAASGTGGGGRSHSASG